MEIPILMVKLVDLEFGEGGFLHMKEKVVSCSNISQIMKDHQKSAFKREESSLTSLKDIWETLHIADIQNA